MRRGAKSKPPTELKAAGTFRRDRHGALTEIEMPPSIPRAPDWLTEHGRAAWADLLDHVVAACSATEADSAMLGTLCNLIGATTTAWRAGDVPPAAHLAEMRRLAEVFRVAGAVSRVGLKVQPSKENSFARNGVSPRGSK